MAKKYKAPSHYTYEYVIDYLYKHEIIDNHEIKGRKNKILYVQHYDGGWRTPAQLLRLGFANNKGVYGKFKFLNIWIQELNEKKKTKQKGEKCLKQTINHYQN